MTKPFPMMILWIAFLSLYSCRKADEVSPLYFALLPHTRAGNERPTTPMNLTASYLFPSQVIFLQWEGSTDPDFNVPVGIYKVYIYLNGTPSVYYESKNLLDETGETFYSLDSDPYTGNIHFVVTGFDGEAESLPSNTATLNLLNP